MITMKNRFFILGLAAVLFAACAVNEVDKANPAMADGGEDVTFYASIEGADTRVYADDQLRVLWNADDRVSIFNRTTYNRQYRFDGQDGDNSGVFKKVPTDDFVTSNPLDYVYSVYPYKEETKISNDGELTVFLPAEQTYREDSFGLGANTMIAVADDNELMFKNLCGYLMLRLYGDNVAVTSISLKGNNNEPLAGKASVVAAIGADPTLSLDASATGVITLTCPTPVTIGTTAATATAFWLVVPPTTFTNGITITVETGDGRRFEKRTTGRLVISRNTRSKMAALEVIPGYMNPSHYLTFTSEGTTTLSLRNYMGNAPELYYSFDKTIWTQWDYSELSFTGSRPLYLCGDNPDGLSTVEDDTLYYSTFISGGSNFSVSGDIMSLINKDEAVTVIPSSHCFDSLFRLCSGLTSGPELPATTLTEYCYHYLFGGCTSLTTAPALPATTLAGDCYRYMFDNCTSLTTAPELPATTLAEGCYRCMFQLCSGLAVAPELTAIVLAARCYDGMFYECTGLTTAPELPATTLADNCYRQMFKGCTSLTTAPELPATTLAERCYDGMFWLCPSLAAAPALPATTLDRECYARMFYGCTSLTTAPELPAPLVAEACYYEMFSDCTSLTSAPELSAMVLESDCYRSMFKNCSSLTTAPELPATTLASNCYISMFKDCSSLTTAPSLPATTLAPRCYYCMFWGCPSLSNAPALPAMTLAQECYSLMFQSCTSLTAAPELPATTLADHCYHGMFSGCTSLTTTPELPAAELVANCYSIMFSGCSQLNYVKCMATDISADNCITQWLDGVAATGTFIKAAGMNDWRRGVSGIPYEWTVEYPVLQAKWRFSAEDCLGAMDGTSYGYTFSAGVPTYKDGAFNGFEKAYSKVAGDGGLFVDSNVSPGGRISYVQIDKTEIDRSQNASRTVGSTGHPYVAGSWIGDYWLFTLSGPENTVYPAGTKVHIRYQSRVSQAGFLYWMLECWNGEAWVPARAVQDITLDTDSGPQSFQYNLLFESNTNQIIDCTYELAVPCAVQQFRQRCMSNIYMMDNSTWTRPMSNTSRIAGNESVQPVFEILATE